MRRMKKVLAFVLATTLVFGTMVPASFAAEASENSLPEVTVQLIPGGENSNTSEGSVGDGTVSREVSVTTSEVETATKQTTGELQAIQPALKFDRNDTADQKAQKVARELYTDNGHFHDPATFTVTDAPEGYPFKYVGHGDYSGHYVSHVIVIYERDEAGNPIKDENGNFVIKELQHVSSGTPLHYGKELTTNIDGPYHFATGTRPQQFLLMDEAGNSYYGYCIDLATGANSGTWYALANLEDNDYYATQEAKDHVRGIVFNGYWGTESGTGSLANLKEVLKAAIADGSVEDDYNIKMTNRKKFTSGYELKEGEYHYGSYVYWDIPAVDVTLTAEIIDQMTEGEALDAMQAAIWSYANGSQATLNGVDGVVVGDMSAASSQMSDSLNGQNDPEGAARTRALYSWLMKQTAEAGSVIINDKTFVEDMYLTIGNKVGEDAFEAKLSFSNSFTVDQNQDDLKVVLEYVDAEGVTQTVEKALTGENALIAEDGCYTIDGLVLNKNNPFEFTLNIVGEQYLTKNAYIFTSESGTYGSQTMVSMAEGNISVDVAKTVSATFSTEASTSLSLKKVDEEGNALTGAEFTLTSDANPEQPTVYAVNENGELVIENLQPGSYKLAETKVPEGYYAPLEDIFFDVDENYVLKVKDNRYVSFDDNGVLNVVNEGPVTVSGSKTWDDADNKDGIRPESITINLLADGELIQTKTVTEEDNWSWTFAGLEKYNNGKEIVYTITEDDVDGYTTTIEGYNVTNTHVPEEDKELPPDEPVIDEPQDDPAEEPEEDAPVVEEDPKQELPEDENIIDEPENDPVIDEPEEDDPVIEEDPKQELPEDENIIDEPAPDTGDHAPIMMLMLIAAVSFAGMVTLSYKRK